jgi:2-polyprenyl-3-methyl-5-hydroxy-6-metoxy-1,4-benzoquinol methylase
MASEDQARWDKQHAEARGADTPASFLRQVFETDVWQLPRGRALDIACGQGRNSLYLAERGFEVVAMDISAVALDEARKRAELKQLRIDWRQTDLDTVQLGEAVYDVVANFNYLQRSLIPQIKRAVKHGGYVIFETYLIDQKEHGHPKNPDYLLRHNELLEHFREFRILCYREGRFSEGGEASYRAGILAQRIA